jgi:Sec-independent protein translocase protein TatA
MELLNVGGLELIFLLGFAIIIFGPQKAIELVGQIGRFVATLRRNLNMIQEDLRTQIHEETQALRETQQSLRELGTDLKADVDRAVNGSQTRPNQLDTPGGAEETATEASAAPREEPRD